jgi:MFS family permease
VAALATVPALMTPVIVWLGVRETFGRRSPRTTTDRQRGLHPRLVRFLIVTALFTLGNSSDAFLVLRARDAGASVLHVLAMLLVFNLAYAGLSVPWGSASDRWGRRRVIAAGWLLYGAVYSGFAFASTAALWPLYALYGVYHAMTDGVAKAFVADLAVEDATRGTAYGVYHATVGVVALPASLLAGVLWQGVGGWSGLGPAAPFLFGAAMALAAAVLVLRWV